MTLYLLSEWEINSWHDSDFESAVWDTDENCVRRIEVGSTRYAGGCRYDDIVTDELPNTILDAAIDWLAETMFYYMRLAEDHAVLEPNEIQEGDRVRLLRDVRNKSKVVVLEPCWSCDGTGNWINPRNQEDVRDCFKCGGTGTHEKLVTADKVDGKVQWEHFDEGLAGTVQWAGTFNTIYQRGYNKLDRSTISTRIKLDDGRLVNAPLNALRLDKEPATDAELMERAQARAQSCKFGSVLNPRWAWDSRNNASRVLAERNRTRI